MSAIDVSNKLGEYLLKGWILTDEVCPNGNCPVPLMRSPKGHLPITTFCVNCDGGPQNARASASGPAKPSPAPGQSSPSTTSTDTRLSRSSTPPTEISSGLSSPTFALPVETAESVRRRRQADAASAEIGARLLKGWAMLADECPNEHCYGIPLVRPPLAGGRDPRKECVACGTVYVSEKDASGWEHLIAAEQRASSSSTVVPAPASAVASPVPVPTVERMKGTSHEFPIRGEAGPSVDVSNIRTAPIDSSQAASPQASALEFSGASLELALHSLSQRLSTQAGNSVAVEPGAIANTADAMSKVLEALAQVHKLRGDNVP